MVSERTQRRIDALLDEAELTADQEDWSRVADLADRVLALEAANEDAMAYGIGFTLPAMFTVLPLLSAAT